MTSSGVRSDPRAIVRQRFEDVRAATEELAAPLSAEDQVIQSMPDCSPTKWHRGHTTWFFEEFVLATQPGYRRFDAAFRFLFNSYYEAVGPRQPRPRRGMITRPSVAEVAAYRRMIDRQILDLLDDATVPERVVELVELGTHHEQQHQELLLMDIKHALFQNPQLPAYVEPRTPLNGGSPAPPVSWQGHEGGLVEIGHHGDGFAFDNEAPRHRVWLDPFAIADRPVSNGDWLGFIADDGYRRPDLWLSDGWATVQAQQWRAPLYWLEEDDGGWSQFTLSGAQPLDPAAPVVHVSYYEADAFARWNGQRLPTEAEWETIAPDPGSVQSALHPVADPGSGLRQVFGAVWQWTASPYTAYPGFRPAEGAVGEYNGKFMVDQQVLRGSAAITPPGHVRRTYRNFFPAAARWPFTGVRLAVDA